MRENRRRKCCRRKGNGSLPRYGGDATRDTHEVYALTHARTLRSRPSVHSSVSSFSRRFSEAHKILVAYRYRHRAPSRSALRNSCARSGREYKFPRETEDCDATLGSLRFLRCEITLRSERGECFRDREREGEKETSITAVTRCKVKK